MKMKSAWIILPIMLLLFGFSKKDKVTQADLQGTWILQSEKVLEVTSLAQKTITKKSISDKHFVWSKYTEDGTLIAMAGGTYMLEEGDIYTENIEFAFPKGSTILGASIPFDCKISEKSWTHSGFIQHREIDSETGAREVSRTERLTEIWKKVE